MGASIHQIPDAIAIAFWHPRARMRVYELNVCNRRCRPPCRRSLFTPRTDTRKKKASQDRVVKREGEKRSSSQVFFAPEWSKCCNKVFRRASTTGIRRIMSYTFGTPDIFVTPQFTPNFMIFLQWNRQIIQLSSFPLPFRPS